MAYNDISAIISWVDQATDKATLTDEQKAWCREKGHELAERRLWRGDISEAWRAQYPWINGTHIDLHL